MSQRIVHIKDLKPHQARTWLMENDPEAADYWAGQAVDEELVECVNNNLVDFGMDCGQVGAYMVLQDEYLPWQRGETETAILKGRKWDCY